MTTGAAADVVAIATDEKLQEVSDVMVAADDDVDVLVG